jgi:hypothetical protein
MRLERGTGAGERRIGSSRKKEEKRGRQNGKIRDWKGDRGKRKAQKGKQAGREKNIKREET